MDIITVISYKRLTKDTNFSNYLLILNAYFNIPKLYEIENITAEEVMDKLDVFQERFLEVNEFGWWYTEIFQTGAVHKFTSKGFQ